MQIKWSLLYQMRGKEGKYPTDWAKTPCGHVEEVCNITCGECPLSLIKLNEFNEALKSCE